MPAVTTPTTGRDLHHRQRVERPSSILYKEHDVALQIRRYCTSGYPAGDANVGDDLVLVAHVGGREVQTPLPDDERSRAFGHDSTNARK
jgi:hypothetical protein